MSIVVSDLVARIRSEGVETTTAQVRAVGAEAARTARALEIMAGQFAKMHGGTAAEALTMFQRTGAQPTAAAMAEAARSAEKTTAAVQAAVPHTQAAARHAEDVAKGWSAADSSAVRFGAGILGIGLGFSLVAGAARLVHDAIAGIVSAQLDWERSLVNLSGLYGEAGVHAAALATAQSNLPGVLGSQQEFAQAAINASDLSLRYGLPQSTINQLTTTGGRIAYATGMTEQADRAQLQAQIAAAVRTGAALPARYGVYTDEEAVSRRLGFGAPQALQAYAPQQVMEARAAIVSEGGKAFADRAAANSRAALAAATAAEKASEQLRNAVQNTLENFGTGDRVEPVAGILAAEDTSPYSALTRERRAALGLPNVSGPNAAGAGGFVDYEGNARTVAAAADLEAQALNESARAQAAANQVFDELGHSVEAAGAQLLNFAGALTDTQSIAHGDILAQAQGAVAARAVGPNPIEYQSPAEIQAYARNRAAQDAWSTYVERLAQQEQPDVIRANLERLASMQGPGLEAQRGAANQALTEQDRRQIAEPARRAAQQGSALAALAQAEAQAQLTTITLQQDERRLAVAEQLAGIRSEALQLEGAMAPLLLQQADLQDRMVVAARDNLETRRELIQAQQQELRTTQITSAYDYEQQRLKLRAQQSLGSILAGTGPTEDFGELQRQYFATQVQRAASGVDIEALDAARRVQVSGQQRTGEQLARDETLAGLEGEARALDDQTRPLAAILRATLAREASIQRTLALMDLQDTKAVAAAQHAINAANTLALKAAEAERAAADLAAGITTGATSAERFADAMSRGYAAINDSAVAVGSIHDMLTTMPELIVPTQAAAPANGGSRVPGSEFAIPTEFTPFPNYDPNRAFDQFPGLPSGAMRSTELHPTHEDAAGTRSLATLTAPSTAQPGGGINIPFNFTVAGQTPQQIKDQVHQAVEDALNNFFSGAAAGGTPAPGSVAGAGR